MTTTIPSQFAIDLAAVCGTTPKNNDKISAAIKQAKDALSIDKLTRSLTADDKAAIIEWHKSLSDNKQVDIETLTPAVALRTDNAIIEEVETITVVAINGDIEQVETIIIPLSQTDLTGVEVDTDRLIVVLNELELLKVENERLQARVAVIDAKHAPTYADNETVRITFNALGKRQGLWLKGYLANALMLATGIHKKGITAWLSGQSFDSDDKNITAQVKLLIVRELEKAYK